MSDAQRYLTDKLEPIELANGGPAAPAWRQAVVVLASDYDALAQRCRELEACIAGDHTNLVALLRVGQAQAERERDALRAEVERLQRELATAHADASHYASRAEELRQDAERYRALRRSLGGAPGCVSADMPRVHVPLRTDLTYSPEGLDRAIDAAMRNEQ